MDFQTKAAYDINDLLQIMKLLRSPNGCPWDREQDHNTIRRNLIEETYEAVEAIDNGDAVLLKEELGDVLLQVVFHAQMEEEKDNWGFQDVCDGICKKLILRHPHIFSGAQAGTAEEVLQNWDQIKKKEKNQQTIAESARQVSRALPALIRSEKVQGRVAASAFDYQDAMEALSGLESETAELKQAISEGCSRSVYEELGDLLFSAVNVARLSKIDPEKCLSDSCDKFIGRFTVVEQLAKTRGIQMEQTDMGLLNSLWQEAKK